MDRIGIHNNRALLNLAVVVNVPVVHADGLDASGTDLDKDPAIVDGEVANPDQLIALGNIGELAGVDIVGVGGDSNFAFAGLFVVHDVPVVNADFLGVRGLSGGPDLDEDPAVMDIHITQVDDFIPLGHIGQLGGVDLVGIGRDSNLALAGLDIVLNVPIVDADIPLNKNGNLTVLDG